MIIHCDYRYSPGPACPGCREGGEGEADGLPQQLDDGHEQELAHVARHHGPHTQRQHAAGDQQPGGRAAGPQPHHGRAHPLRIRPQQRGHQVRGVELSANLREVLQCPEKAPIRAFSLLKAWTQC